MPRTYTVYTCTYVAITSTRGLKVFPESVLTRSHWWIGYLVCPIIQIHTNEAPACPTSSPARNGQACAFLLLHHY